MTPPTFDPDRVMERWRRGVERRRRLKYVGVGVLALAFLAVGVHRILLRRAAAERAIAEATYVASVEAAFADADGLFSQDPALGDEAPRFADACSGKLRPPVLLAVSSLDLASGLDDLEKSPIALGGIGADFFVTFSRAPARSEDEIASELLTIAPWKWSLPPRKPLAREGTIVTAHYRGRVGKPDPISGLADDVRVELVAFQRDSKKASCAGALVARANEASPQSRCRSAAERRLFARECEVEERALLLGGVRQDLEKAIRGAIAN